MGMEVKCCGNGWGRKPCLMGTDGDGYNFCGNGWGWLDFPLPCRSLVSTTWRRVTSLPSSNRRATLITGSVYARRRRPSSMFLAPNMWPSVAVRSVQLQLVCGMWNSLPTAVQSSESLNIFRCHLKTELFDCSYNWHRACQTTLLLRDSLPPSRSFLLWPQPWSLSTIMLLWHSFVIIIVIIMVRYGWYSMDFWLLSSLC